DLLNLLNLGTVDITDRSVSYLLKLSDQFQIERVLNLCEKHLLKSTGFDEMNKLLLADQFIFKSLKELVLQSFSTLTDLAAKLKSPEYENLSSDMKAAICDRLAKLV
ncbi:hypothetical protein PMAYCL1PPCAC_26973, partial [Pristionchus mayeri]